MTWEAIGALSELFGAVAVVASLLYLSRQLHMTREVDKVATFQGIFDGFTHHVAQFFGASGDLALRGLNDRASLSPAERLRFDHLLANVLNQAEMTGAAVQAGLMTTEEIGPLEWWFRNKLFCYPGAREWINEFAGAYPKPYVAMLQRAAAASVAADEAS